MKNRKNVILVWLFVIAAVIGFIFSACKDPDTHEHIWSEWTVTTAANCTSAGLETRICATDASHVENRFVPIDINAHVWGNWVVSVQVTAEEDGYETGTCIYNSSHTEERIKIAFNHTCTWGAWAMTTNPTCTTSGINTRTCNQNSKHKDTQSVPIDPNEHNWGSWVVTTAATATKDGVETETCTYNDAHKETRPIQHTTHNWGSWRVTTPATCTTEGSETRTCSHQAPHSETQHIPSLEHNWSNWRVTTPATCTTTGSETRTCSRQAPHSETQHIPSLQHNWQFGWRKNDDVYCARGDCYSFTDLDDLNNVLYYLLNLNNPHGVYTLYINMSLTTWDNFYSGYFGSFYTNYSFYGSLNLDLSACTGTTLSGHSWGNNSVVVSFIMPNTVTNIDADAFSNCTSLRSVTFNTNGITIASDAFLGDLSTKYQSGGSGTYTTNSPGAADATWTKQ